MKNKSEIQIAGIKLCSGGQKGLEVLYSKVEVGVDGRDWINEYWTSRSLPINEELDGLVKAFRFYLYDVYGYDMENVNQAELEILEVKSDGGNFVIIGKMKVLDGTKYVPLKTCKILGGDDYDKYEEVIKLVGQLYKEVEMYMSGMRDKVNDVQIVLDFNKSKGLEFDEVAFRGMAGADQRDMATKILEKMGSIVIHRDEVNGEEVVDANQVDLEVSIAEVTSPEGRVDFVTSVPFVSAALEVQPSFDAVVEPVKVKVPKVVKAEKVLVVNGEALKPAVKPLFSAPNFGDVVEQVSVVPPNLTNDDDSGEELSFNITAIKTV